MASSFNRVILAGNMTRDPEARALPSGQALTKFSLAVNRAYTTKEGEKREEVTYVDIESYGKQAEIIAKYCGKGSGILVEGRLKLDQWEDKKTGEKRSRLGVVLENFTFIGGRAQDRRGVFVVPDILANAGGVTASYFEWVQIGRASCRERV